MSKQHSILRLTHFTPTAKHAWRWLLMYPVMTVLAGPQETITGETVMTPSNVGVWSGSNAYPSFETRAEGIAWCDANKITLDAIEIE